MKAFTLIETMIAVTILMLVATGIIFSLGNSLKVSAGSDTRIQAQLLAEEGTELVRAIRDANLLQEKDFKIGISRNSKTSTSQDKCVSACSVLSEQDGVVSMSSCVGSACTIEPYTSGSWFTTNSGQVSRSFARRIVVKELSDTELVVTSTISYDERGSTQSVTNTTVLTQWYE